MASGTTQPIGPHSGAERLRSVDGRTRLGRFMSELRTELYEALGTDNPTPMQRIIVDRIIEKSARCTLLSRQMLNGGGMSAEAERRYAWHANSLRRDLATLGLERRGKGPPSLQEHLEREYGGAAA